ncbi:MAG: RelA/SpoT family protein [Prevotellaceae bacterium]|jgi:GTP pyrophosphokinase|nr:RelA/SpoT family protein [Prevotellaceae bacterium]
MTDEQQIQQAYELLLDDYKKSGHRQDLDLVERAFQFANTAHKGVKRRSGEPYMMHPLAVARIAVGEIGLGTTSLCSALLHDVVEDTDYTVADIENLFGKRIASFVDGLTKISGGVFGAEASVQAENFRKVLLTMFNDPRIIMIKIADRLHNMRTLASMPPAKQYKIAGETLYIYAPLAYRLGLFKIKTELEDLSFKYEHPEIFEEISRKLAADNSLSEEVYQQFIAPIQKALKAMGYDFYIEKRIKTVYSIWHKMQTKKISFEEVFDLLAVRIIFKCREDISEKEQSWKIYTVVTNNYKPHPERLRDWISTPKANGYEALHTTVMSTQGHWIEVQIRSERMHEIAERGLSAHWKYKSDDNSPATELDKWLESLKEVLASDDPNAIDFLDTFKLNLFANEIIVFTPKGEAKILPQGATALDFAFSLHSDIGMHCIGAKVNHKLEPLSHVLSSGDQVEILTSHSQKPQAEWINYVTTARARAKLKSVFKKENRLYIEKGRVLLEEKFKELGLPADNQNIQLALNFFHLTQRNELYYELGYGIRDLQDIDKKIFKKKSNKWTDYLKFPFSGLQKHTEPKPESDNTKSKSQKIDRKKVLQLSDKSSIHYKVAECCHPIPGDDILGYIDDDDNSVVLHKLDCPVAAKLKSNHGENIVSVNWHSKRIQSFPVVIEIRGIDAQGVLVQIIKMISQDYSVDIRKINIDIKDGIFTGNFHIFVHDAEEVDKIGVTLSKIKSVKSVKRIEETETQQANDNHHHTGSAMWFG